VDTKNDKIPLDLSTNVPPLAVFVGSHITKTVLSSLFYYLLCNKEKLDKLREEVDRFYPPGEPLSNRPLEEMYYLDACINEALRLSPPFPSTSLRDAGPGSGSSKGRTFGP
jgi:cytochrome P450